MAVHLHTARRNLGLTQKAAAEKMDVDASAVSRWERGEALPSVPNVAALARVYRIDLNELLNLLAEAQAEEIVEVSRDREAMAEMLREAIAELRAGSAEMRAAARELRSDSPGSKLKPN